MTGDPFFSPGTRSPLNKNKFFLSRGGSPTRKKGFTDAQFPLGIFFFGRPSVSWKSVPFFPGGLPPSIQKGSPFRVFKDYGEMFLPNCSFLEGAPFLLSPRERGGQSDPSFFEVFRPEIPQEKFLATSSSCLGSSCATLPPLCFSLSATFRRRAPPSEKTLNRAGAGPFRVPRRAYAPFRLGYQRL